MNTLVNCAAKVVKVALGVAVLATLLVVLLVTMLITLLCTDSGAQRVVSWAPEALQVEGFDGNLRRGLYWQSLNVRTPSSEIRVGKTRLPWQFEGRLLRPNLHVLPSEIANVQVFVGGDQPEENQAPTKAFQPFDLWLPIDLVFDELVVGEVTTSADVDGIAQNSQIVRSAKLSAQFIDETLDINELSLDAEQFSFSSSGGVTFAEAWPLELNAKAAIVKPEQELTLGLSGTLRHLILELTTSGVVNATFSAEGDAIAQDVALKGRATSNSLAELNVGVADIPLNADVDARWQQKKLFGVLSATLGDNTVKANFDGLRGLLEVSLQQPGQLVAALTGEITLSGDFDATDDVILRLTGDWQNLVHPMSDRLAHLDLNAALDVRLIGRQPTDTTEDLLSKRLSADIKLREDDNFLGVEYGSGRLVGDLNVPKPGRLIERANGELRARIAVEPFLDSPSVAVDFDWPGYQTRIAEAVHLRGVATLSVPEQAVVLDRLSDANYLWELSRKTGLKVDISAAKNRIRLSKRSLEFDALIELPQPQQLHADIKGALKGTVDFKADGKSANLLSNIDWRDFPARSGFDDTMDLKVKARLDAADFPLQQPPTPEIMMRVLDNLNATIDAQGGKNTASIAMTPKRLAVKADLMAPGQLQRGLTGSANVSATALLANNKPSLNMTLRWKDFSTPDGRPIQIDVDGDLSAALPMTWSALLNQQYDRLTLMKTLRGKFVANAGSNVINLLKTDNTVDLLADVSAPGEIAQGLSGHLEAVADIDVVDNFPAGEFVMKWQEFVMPDGSSADINAKVIGSDKKHQIRFAADRSDASWALALDGSFKRTLSDFDWRGDLQQFDLAVVESASFKLRAPVNLKLSSTHFSMDELCLGEQRRAAEAEPSAGEAATITSKKGKQGKQGEQGKAASSICFVANKRDQLVRSSGTILDLPISLFSPWIGLPPWMDFSINGAWQLKETKALDANLSVAMLDLPPAGIKLKATELVLESKGFEEAELRGSTMLGDAKIQISGEGVNTNSGLKINATLQGPAAIVVNRPELRIKVKPDFTVNLDPQRGLKLRGTATLLDGNIDLQKLSPSSGPTLSDDVVVLDERKVKDAETALAKDVRINLAVQKPLRIVGYGFKGDVLGDLVVRQTGSREPTARGELNIHGRYKAWGQDLTVRRGKLYYQDTPLDNPLIDLVAGRTVEDYEVGVTVSGTANQPVVKLYSTPAVNEAAALQMLVTGRPPGAETNSSEKALMQSAITSLGLKGGNWLASKTGGWLPVDEFKLESDEATGNTGVLIGRQLTEKLYVGYKVLVESAQQAVQLRYSMSKICELTATSGTSTEGGIACRVER